MQASCPLPATPYLVDISVGVDQSGRHEPFTQRDLPQQFVGICMKHADVARRICADEELAQDEDGADLSLLQCECSGLEMNSNTENIQE